VSVGTGGHNDVRIANFVEESGGVTFTLWWQGRPWAGVRWTQTGLFNARNAAMAATAAQLALCPEAASLAEVTHYVTNGVDGKALKLEALSRFRGVKRRQETLVATPALTVIEDFGHHPTALAETLQSLRARFAGAVLTAVFEPRSNTARTSALQAGFLRALAFADEVYLGAVSRAEKLAAAERFDAEGVAQQLGAQGIRAEAFPTNRALLEKLSEATLGANRERRVVVFFTNGSFDGIIAGYAAAASAR
jgi:UDP-N-acetylmuramate: L-alanyl-gamma-D-glutamyl-meso-diaminopimelate ligase